MLLLLGGTVQGVLFVALDLLIDNALYSRFDAALAARAQALAALVEARRPLAAGITERWPEYAERAHEDFYQLWDTHGRSAARSPSSGGADLPRPPASAGTGSRFYDVVLPDGHGGRAVAMPVRQADGSTALLVVATEREALDTLERRVHLLLAGGIAASLVLFATLALQAVRRSLAPLAAFTATLAAPAALPPALLPRELVPIAHTLQAAFERLLAALAREQRFARAAAHELRTPLAELMTVAETLRADATDAATRQRADHMLAAIDDMTRAVDALLALARAEAGLEPLHEEPLDLVALLVRQLALVQPALAERAIATYATLPAECWVLGDAALLERIFANLLGNVLHHAPRDSTLTVVLEDGESIAVRVANAASAAQVTAARAGLPGAEGTTGDVPHVGLGLQLARALAEALGLRFELPDAPAQLEVRLAGFRRLAA